MTDNRMLHAFFRCGLLLLTTSGCSGALTGPFSTLDPLRQHALEHPEDKRAAELLALGEVFHHDGDPSRAEDSLLTAKQLDPANPTITYLLGVWANLHGRPAEALGHFIASLRLGAEGAERLRNRQIAELSIRSLESLSERVPRFIEVIAEPLAAILEDASLLPAELKVELSLLLSRAYRGAGQSQQAAALSAQAGCLPQWRIAGPFGPQAMLAFDKELAPDRSERLEERYDLGRGRGTHPTREHESRSCTVQLGSPRLRRAGVSFAEATQELSEGGKYIVYLNSAAVSQLSIDGNPVLRMDARNEPNSLYRSKVIALEAGVHRIRVKVASRHPNPHVAVALIKQRGAEGGQEPPAASSLERLATTYIEAQLTFLRGNPVGARDQLRERFSAGAAGSAPLLPQYLLAFITMADPYRSASTRQNEARRWFESIADLEDRSFVARLQLARMTQRAGRTREAIQAMRELHGQLPEVDAVTAQLASALLREGWATEADRVLEPAAARESVSCLMMAPLIESAQQQGKWEDAETWARRARSCTSGEQRLFSVLTQRRKTSEAQTVLRRLVGRTAPDQRSTWIPARLELARAAGDDEEVERLINQQLREQPWSIEASVQAIDHHLARNEHGQAMRLIEGRVAEDPSSQGELLLLRDLIADLPILAEQRVNGAEMVRAFEEADKEYDAPEVMVLDHTVIQIFDDGSSIELTHNIWKVQSEAAADQRGEYSAPAGAHLLQLHTLVPGADEERRRIEPEPIPGKDSYSLPALLPGRFVEVEYVIAHPASPRLNGGYLGPRFFFQSLEESFDQSQLTLIVPTDANLEVDARGAAPDVVETHQGTHRILRWSVQESRAYLPEPNAVVPHEWLPSVNVGIDASWTGTVGYIRDLLADRDPMDPAAKRFVSETLANAHADTDPQKAVVLYDWVLDNIDENNDVFGLAPAMLYDRAGSRARVLRYLLSLAEIDAELWFARSLAEDSSASSLPEPGRFRNLLIAVDLGLENPVQLYTEDRFAPFGYLPAMLRGQQAIRLVDGAPATQTVQLETDLDKRVVEVNMAVSEDGSVTASFREALHGALALRWRSDLSQIPEALLEDRFAQHYLPQIMPGGELTGLRIQGTGRGDGPLVLEYQARHSDFARSQGDRLLLPYPWRSNLRAQYAPNATRRTPQLVAPGEWVDIRVQIQPAAGLQFASLPGARSLRGPGESHAAFDADLNDQGALELRQRVVLPLSRLPAEQYPGFVSFCQQIDTLELRELALTSAVTDR